MSKLRQQDRDTLSTRGSKSNTGYTEGVLAAYLQNAVVRLCIRLSLHVVLYLPVANLGLHQGEVPILPI